MWGTSVVSGCLLPQLKAWQNSCDLQALQNWSESHRVFYIEYIENLEYFYIEYVFNCFKPNDCLYCIFISLESVLSPLAGWVEYKPNKMINYK